MSLKRIRARAWMTAMIITLMFGGVTLVLWLGAQDVIAGRMTPGALLQFVLLSVFVAGAVGALGESWGDVQKAAGAMQRIDELMRAQPGIRPPAAPKALPEPAVGEVEMRDVNFAYPGRPDLPALRDFTLSVRPGETVALVGPSGAGKSTVFRLLLRFYDPQSGQVRVDGVEAATVDPVALRSRFAWVSQEAPLFSGSAIENIRFGREDAGVDEVRDVAERAQALAFVEALPEGFDTPLDALIVNAGITGARHQSAQQATGEEVAEVMMTNAFGPVRLAKTLLPRVADGGTIAFMTSLMGSIEDSSGGYELYRTSKCALNMLAKGVAEQDAGPRNIATLALHPGWVQTDMGGPNAPTSVDESVKGLADVVESAGGGEFRYVDYTGKDLPF